MEIIQIAGYSLAGGLLGYGLPQLGWDLAQRQNGHTAAEDTEDPNRPSATGNEASATEGSSAFDLKHPAG